MSFRAYWRLRLAIRRLVEFKFLGGDYLEVYLKTKALKSNRFLPLRRGGR